MMKVEDTNGSRRNHSNKSFLRMSSLSPVVTSPRPKRSVVGSRLYRAPQALIRSDSITKVPLVEDKTGKTRRRRPRESSKAVTHRTQTTRTDGGSGFTLERQLSSSSLMVDNLEPPLWKNDDDDDDPFHNSVPEELWTAVSTRNRRHHRNHHLYIPSGGGGGGPHEDFSENFFDDDSVNGTYHSYDPHELKEKPALYKSFLRYANLIQILIILTLGGIIYDSRQRVNEHKAQIKQYDDERAHLLEQMMWIDKAAKKVHSKYGLSGLLPDPTKESREELLQETSELREGLEKLKVRIQANGREFIQNRFGENPVRVSLSMNPQSTAHLVIGLSDDTPHAAATFIQQVDRKMWDNTHFQRLESGTIQVSSDLPSTSPILEFVEKSRGCHEHGAVSLHEFDDKDVHMLVLRIHTEASPGMDENDVCIGKVLSGLDRLQKLPELPLIHDSPREQGPQDGEN